MRRWLFVVLMVWCVRAGADVVLDQEQPFISDTAGWSAIGGDVEQKLSQTVTAGITGRLVEVHAPIACRSGELILEIRELDGDVPSGRFLSIDVYPISDFPRSDPPPAAAFQRMVLSHPIFFEAGDRFAIQLRDKSGECTLARSPSGTDLYSRGEGWFINNTPPTTDWTRMPVAGSQSDWAFKTFVEVAPAPIRSGPCTIHGVGGPGGFPIPFIPEWAPVCRCLQDEGLRETRCALLNPDFFMIRRIPSLKPDETFKVTWTLVPLKKLTGVIEVDEKLPDGFKSSLKSPLTFVVDQLPPDVGLTLSYEAIAGKKGGKVETSILFTGAGQQLTTSLDLK